MKTTTKPAPQQMAATQKRDIRYLDKHGAQAGAPIPPQASATIAQLYEVDRLANVGANLAQIGAHLRIDPEIWQQMLEHNPAIGEAYRDGYTRFQIEIMERLAFGAKGGDASLIRLAADRGMLGKQWEHPKVQQVQIMGTASPVQVDVVASVDALFARQRALIESTTIEAETPAGGDSEKGDSEKDVSNS